MYVVIAGVGLVGEGLTRRLVKNNHDVVLIDKDKAICDKLYAETGVIAINGNAESFETLREASIEKADVFVGAMNNDADNLACAIIARSLGVPRIIVGMRKSTYEKAYELAGVDSVISLTELMENQMVMAVENPKVRKIITIGKGNADIYMILIPHGAKAAGLSIEEIAKNKNFPSQCIFASLYSNESGEFSIPKGQNVIKEKDEIFLISKAEDINKAVDFLTKLK